MEEKEIYENGLRIKKTRTKFFADKVFDIYDYAPGDTAREKLIWLVSKKLKWTTKQIADAFQISHQHTKKIINKLKDYDW